jgi:hypothetical protein
MSTFGELQTRLTAAKQKKIVLQHLIDHLDTNFVPSGGNKPKNFLLDEQKVPLPSSAFESVIADLLLAESQELDQEIHTILQATVAPQAAPQQTTKKTKPAPQAQQGETK